MPGTSALIRVGVVRPAVRQIAMSADCGRLDVHNARTSQSSASNGCQNCQLRPQQARSPQAAESNGRPGSSMRATTGPPFPSSSTAISWDHPGGTVHGHVGHSLFETKVNVEGQIRRYALASPGFDPCLSLSNSARSLRL